MVVTERFQAKCGVLESESGDEMVATVVMTLMCTAGIGFYARFLVALSKEQRPRLNGYWVLLRLGSGGRAIAESRERNETMTRAA